MRNGITILALIATTAFAAPAMADHRTGHTRGGPLVIQGTPVVLSLGPVTIGEPGSPVFRRGRHDDDYTDSAFSRTIAACGAGNQTACRMYSHIASTVRLPPQFAPFSAFATAATAPRDPSGEPADPLAVAVSYR